MSETISVHRQGDVVPDEYDDQDNPVVSTPSDFDVVIRAFAPSGGDSSGSTETAQPFGITVIQGGAIYAERGIAFLSTDIITIRGDKWQVQGDVADWVPIREGGPEGIVIGVKRAS